MSKSLILTALFSAGALLSYSQTKPIAFKSHSGSMKLFEAALINPESDIINHNLGAFPIRTVKSAALDSLVFVSDSVAVMVTSECIMQVGPNGPITPPVFEGINLWPQDSSTVKDPEPYVPWIAGRDTLYNHPLFSKQHELNAIKTSLKNDYNFQNDIDSTVFIGYDTYMEDSLESTPEIKTKEKTQDESGSIIINPNDTTTPYLRLGVLVLLLSSVVVFIHLKLHKQEIQRP